MSLLRTVQFVLGHPLNVNRKTRALGRFVRWQITSRLLNLSVILEFANDSRLIVRRGMTGATGNLYCGLHEFEDMSFVLHFLRPEDLFCDVGANVGSYTILASAAIGSRTIAVEPVPATYQHLVDNIQINEVEALVEALNVGIGSEIGELRFTSAFDTTNHVLSGEEVSPGAITIPATTLDQVCRDRTPGLLKIDVEGFETEVIAGAENLLGRRELAAIIMELNGSGERYGYDEAKLHEVVVGFGFRVCQYDPFTRGLRHRTGSSTEGNLLYVRDFEYVAERVASAPLYRVLGRGV